MTDVVLVHGAWHGAWCWDGVIAALERDGISVTAVELPLTGLDDDVAAVRREIEHAGDGLVVVGHSYGGEVISRAAADLPTVKRLVYLAAFMLDNDDDQGAVMSDYGSALPSALQFSETNLTVDPDRVHDLFYGDSDVATSAALAAKLRPMPLVGFSPATAAPAWKSVPSTYVVCTNDGALPPEAQRWMAQRAAEVVEWPTDHSPFVTRPDTVAALVAALVREA
jgi:pimeloyl-ACP methyl ester carboxylesterase